MISNTDRFDGRRRKMPLDRLNVTSCVPKRPTLYSFGCDAAPSHADRNLLLAALRTRSNARTVRKSLANVNARVSKQTESRNLVSKGCMVSSLLTNGTSESENFEQVEGFPDILMGGFNIGNFLKENLQVLPGEKPTVRQIVTSVFLGDDDSAEGGKPMSG